MRVPNSFTYKKWIKYEMFFFLGMIVGALIMLLFFGKELDRLHLTIDSLENENKAYLEDVQKYKEEQAKSQKNYQLAVKDVEIHLLDIQPKADPFIEAEVIKLVKRDTKFLEGKPLNSVNDLHLLLRQHFRDKQFKIGTRNVHLDLKTITIYTTVHLYFTAKVETIAP
ncbi:hypothetical protein J2Z37_000282 [Ammoniphilus resinae]|uniref:Sporulation membrane protein YtrI C-terminal domain-containing protein n=2 Tax=Ammoniphilus resinae TaxID=861532 RepID=A0ABS4GK51_9BACL|nr:hypothetical protein [Ammoniphilus resinae]